MKPTLLLARKNCDFDHADRRTDGVLPPPPALAQHRGGNGGQRSSGGRSSGGQGSQASEAFLEDRATPLSAVILGGRIFRRQRGGFGGQSFFRATRLLWRTKIFSPAQLHNERRGNYGYGNRSYGGLFIRQLRRALPLWDTGTVTTQVTIPTATAIRTATTTGGALVPRPSLLLRSLRLLDSWLNRHRRSGAASWG